MKLKTLSVLLMLMVAFLQSFGQTFELPPNEFEGYVYIIGQFRIHQGVLSTDNNDSLYHYSDMKSRKYDSYDFGSGVYYKPICEGECHFFAYDNKLNKYYFYSDNVIGYVLIGQSSDFAKKLKKGVKDFNVPRVDSQSESDVIADVYNAMENEYKIKNTSILEVRRIKENEYRQTHNWRTDLKLYEKCLLCHNEYSLRKCTIVAIDSNYCYYTSNDPTKKMLGLEYKEIHYSRIGSSDRADVKKFYEMWKDSIDNPKYNPKTTPESAKALNEQKYKNFCEKLRDKAPYGFVLQHRARFNSVYGVEPYFEIFNTNEKSIKYIEFFFSVFNAVNDLCYLDNQPIGSVTGVGPVESFKSASWGWNQATHYTSGDAKYLRIVKLVITYMDGSGKTLLDDSIVINTD